MKGLKVMAMALIVISIAGIVVEELQAETRTLTTTLIVRMKPKPPEIPAAPQEAQELLANALTQSMNERFIKVDTAKEGMLLGNNKTYTLVEKL